MEHVLYIWPDYDYYYQEENGCCGGTDDDEFRLYDVGVNQLLKFVVPGIYEWCARYVAATDFATTTTESWFDWKRWHYDGLVLAKEVYRHLPRNYNLIYRKPFEDRSGILEEVDFSKDDVDAIIQSLGPTLEIPRVLPYVKHNVEFALKTESDVIVSVSFKIGELTSTITLREEKELIALKKWMERIAADDDDVIQSPAFGKKGWILDMIPQRAGRFPQMGQFRIEGEDYDACFEGYVNRREFVRGLYLTLMNHFGFGVYTEEEFRNDDYPKGLERMERWRPYNCLRSDIIEWYITDDLYCNQPIPDGHSLRQVSETVSMWVDYGCCFWDTMGVGSGDEEGLTLDSGDFDMGIPGLREWIDQWELLGKGKILLDDWWKRGWALSQEVRKRLPENVDLYYMCYNPESPEELLAYNGQLPKIIVPVYSSKLEDTSK